MDKVEQYCYVGTLQETLIEFLIIVSECGSQLSLSPQVTTKFEYKPSLGHAFTMVVCIDVFNYIN